MKLRPNNNFLNVGANVHKLQDWSVKEIKPQAPNKTYNNI